MIVLRSRLARSRRIVWLEAFGMGNGSSASVICSFEKLAHHQSRDGLAVMLAISFLGSILPLCRSNRPESKNTYEVFSLCENTGLQL